EALLEERLDHGAEGVVDHPVAKRGGGDAAWFGIVDLEDGVGAWAPGACLERFLTNLHRLMIKKSLKNKYLEHAA
ncbi:MAG: hypothetical protein AAGI34_15645, partial [Pseudomonadota bacterium]